VTINGVAMSSAEDAVRVACAKLKAEHGYVTIRSWFNERVGKPGQYRIERTPATLKISGDGGRQCLYLD
jgi:uncharacterized Ntn-hydrolase superfamily protein